MLKMWENVKKQREKPMLDFDVYLKMERNQICYYVPYQRSYINMVDV